MSFPRYPKNKPSGVEWLGDVPAHWEVKRLKHNLRLKTDKTDRREQPVALENIEGWTGRFIPTETEFQGEGIAFDSGDILFGKLRPYLAKAYLAEFSGEAVGDFHVMRPSESVIGRFAQYQILNREFIAIVDGSTFGSKMPRASWEFVGGMKLPFPPPSEQTAIASFLDHETGKIDVLVEEQRRLIALLKEKRQAVISHAVTKGLNPLAPLKPSGVEWLGDVPVHWEVKKLKYLMSLTSGGTPRKENLSYWDGNVPWASSKDLKTEELFDTQDHISQKALDEGAAELIPSGSILTVVRGMILLHTFPIVVARVPMAINQDLKAILPTAGVDTDFLSWLLRGASDEVLSRTDEAGHGTKVLRMETWLEMKVPVPPLKEQSVIVAAIVRQLGELDTLTAEAHRAIDLLQERRMALISAAVTGKIDVRSFNQN
jgi:type I restriction enzyme, S subunit